MHPDRDPYAPPPRHKDRSGAIVRVLIIAALIGAAAWGYMEFSQSQQTAGLTPPAQEQTLADAGANAGYAVDQPAAQNSETPRPAPSSTPSPAQQPSAPPPPTTTMAPPPAD
jgi:hypothetical protein